MGSLCALIVVSAACGGGSPAADTEMTDVSPADTREDRGEDSGDDAAPDAPIDALIDEGTTEFDCTTARPRPSGEVEDADLDELSGLVASRTQEDVYYAINDSGGPILYVLNEAGESLATYRLDGADNYDFEDIAIGTGPDGTEGDWVFLADVGDNRARNGETPRDEIQVYAVPEPVVGESPETLLGVRTYRYHHSPVAYDVEAIAIDNDGSIVMLTKERGRETHLLRGQQVDGPTTLETVMQRDLDSQMVTAMDVGPRGLLVRTYVHIYLYAGEPGDVQSLLLRDPVRVRPGNELQGEAIAWRADGRGLMTAPEGLHANLWRYDCL